MEKAMRAEPLYDRNGGAERSQRPVGGEKSKFPRTVGGRAADKIRLLALVKPSAGWANNRRLKERRAAGVDALGTQNARNPWRSGGESQFGLELSISGTSSVGIMYVLRGSVKLRL